ncbi:conserved Plasmodium protein, unknown function [Plasmodium gallinaceum]|uniref:Uncharacterized protein n=1 Tax=Plasmodium gallinaceum TaxID=5849 RepID=A0A1J1GN32_PLAGA|nr:conserved Plasmodium protein, unknown function [Plasmodium gallinaceum]CRG93842.1 conserved Plasmodium protein, unknown function [Plasmodium gallinaceum]
MFKYVIFGASGLLSGWILRDIFFFSINNISSTNGILLNKFVCEKEGFFKNIFNELRYCFDPLELKKGFNNYNIYIKENNYFIETLYIEKWNNIKDMNEYINSEENKKNLHYLKNLNIFFCPSLFVLLKHYSGNDIPSYLKRYFE